jgi:hypothetical protein
MARAATLPDHPPYPPPGTLDVVEDRIGIGVIPANQNVRDWRCFPIP